MRGVNKFPDDEEITDGSLDAGLVVLSAITPRGVELSLEDIAYVCGCNRQDIWHIERRAMRKLKAEFARRGLDTIFN